MGKGTSAQCIAYSFKVREQRRWLGACIHCGRQERKKGCLRCVQCLIEINRTQNNRKAELIELGLCYRCGRRKPSDVKKGPKAQRGRRGTICQVCRNRYKVYTANYRKRKREKARASLKAAGLL